MSKGNMTVDAGFNLTVSDNSCASARIAVESFYSGSWKVNSCSTDPVNNGTQLNLQHVLSGSLTKWTVTGTTASGSTDPTDPTNSGSINIEVMLLIAFIFLFFIGFHTGTQNGNR